MTHTSTEQERAEFEKYMLLENYFSERDLVWNGVDGYDCTDADDAFGIWLIARRAQVVPQSIEQMAVDRYKVVPSHSSMFYPCAVVAGDGQQQLYIGREVECQNMARKFTGAFLDGAFVALTAAPQPPEAGLMSEKRTTKPEAAPVQMPEPAFYADDRGYEVSAEWLASDAATSDYRAVYTEPRYTESQVRQLLEAHGIQEQST